MLRNKEGKKWKNPKGKNKKQCYDELQIQIHCSNYQISEARLQSGKSLVEVAPYSLERTNMI